MNTAHPPSTRPPTFSGGSPIRTFQLRRGRVSNRHNDALARWQAEFGLAHSFGTPDSAPFDAEAQLAVFGRTAPLVLEIGSGMGTATVEMAAADPGRDYVAVEVHMAGIANLLRMTAERELTNLRVLDGDALDFAKALPEGSLDAIHVFFPDPWPKARHHKRRLIRPERVALLASRLRPGGVFHCATDWAEYAVSMLEVLRAEPRLANECADYAPRPEYRPVTKFEQRGIDAGREIFDLIFRRVAISRSVAE